MDFTVSKTEADQIAVTFRYQNGKEISGELYRDNAVFVAEAMKKNGKALEKKPCREFAEMVMICAALYQKIYNGGRGGPVAYPAYPKIQNRLLRTELEFASTILWHSHAPEAVLTTICDLELNVSRQYDSLTPAVPA